MPHVVADRPMNQPLGDYAVPNAPRIPERESIARKMMFLLVSLVTLPYVCFVLAAVLVFVDSSNTLRSSLFALTFISPLWIPLIVWRKKNTITNKILVLLLGLSVGSYFIVVFILDIINRYVR